MTDKHFWKNAYQHLWEAASKKEDFIKKLIEQETGFTVELLGLGAGTSSYIPGDAKDNAHEKGDADLYIKEADTFVEVTGPNMKMNSNAPLWFRRDKLANAYKKLTSDIGQNHFVVHVQQIKGTKDLTVRVIHLNKYFFERLINKEFSIITPFIRGNKERYFEIPADSKVVISFNELIKIITTNNISQG